MNGLNENGLVVMCLIIIDLIIMSPCRIKIKNQKKKLRKRNSRKIKISLKLGK